MAFRGLPTSPCLLVRNPPALRPGWLGEVDWLGETISGTSGEVQVDGCSLHERIIVTTIVASSSSRLADQYLAGFLLLLLELIKWSCQNND